MFYIYDFKFDDLLVIVYNYLFKYRYCYKVLFKFYVINFDNLRKSYCCNLLVLELMMDILDVYELLYIIMFNFNKLWV